MDDLRIGPICRALRRRRGWRQLDLASRAGCSQRMISYIERGHLAGCRLSLLRRVFAALDASFDGLAGRRAGDLDRLLDERHAAVIEAVARLLQADAWDAIPEFTYSEFGERGSIDLLASKAPARAIAVFEIKGDVTTINDTVRKHDEKTRLAVEKLAMRRLGWRPAIAGRILVIAEDRTARRRVAAHRATFDAAYPLRSNAVRAWLRRPASSMGGIWFLTLSKGSSGSQRHGGPKRIRVPRNGARGRRVSVESQPDEPLGDSSVLLSGAASD
jgi:transcriptional regulator with XRE-family HTH domain